MAHVLEKQSRRPEERQRPEEKKKPKLPKKKGHEYMTEATSSLVTLLYRKGTDEEHVRYTTEDFTFKKTAILPP